MSKQIIGFATEFYTLWDYNTEEMYTTDARGNHHLSGIKHNYYYLQNISKDLETVKVKFPALTIDDGLRGKSCSFDRVDRIELPVELFQNGKYQGHLISDVAKTDIKYVIWALENMYLSTDRKALINALPEVTEFYIQKEKEERECYGELVLLKDGRQSIEITTNGRSDFHINDEKFDQYNGKPYMVASIENEKGYYTYVKIILDDAKQVDGRYPYLMPIINGKAMKTKGKTLELDLKIIGTWGGLSEATQIAVINS